MISSVFSGPSGLIYNLRPDPVGLTTRRKTLEGRIDKLKTWQKRANTVLPMIGTLLG